MTSSNLQLASLNELTFVPYLDEQGHLPEQFAGKVGVYAIFDDAKVLHFVGYSRDIVLSLKQHLVRCPHQCRWIKVETVERPSRTLLEQVKTHWIEQNGSIPPGNSHEAQRWTQPIDVKTFMNEAEQEAIAKAVTDLERSKALKKVARRIEADLLETLTARGARMPIRFDPKMKEQGLLNLKPE